MPLGDLRNRSPTTETAMLRFGGVMGLRIEAGDQVVRQVHGLDAHCLTVLEMLRVPIEVFTSAHGKFQPTGPPTSGI